MFDEVTKPKVSCEVVIEGERLARVRERYDGWTDGEAYEEDVRSAALAAQIVAKNAHFWPRAFTMDLIASALLNLHDPVSQPPQNLKLMTAELDKRCLKLMRKYYGRNI